MWNFKNDLIESHFLNEPFQYTFSNMANIPTIRQIALLFFLINSFIYAGRPLTYFQSGSNGLVMWAPDMTLSVIWH